MKPQDDLKLGAATSMLPRKYESQTIETQFTIFYKSSSCPQLAITTDHNVRNIGCIHSGPYLETYWGGGGVNIKIHYHYRKMLTIKLSTAGRGAGHKVTNSTVQNPRINENHPKITSIKNAEIYDHHNKGLIHHRHT